MLTIDPASPLPPYEQVRHQLTVAIDCGDVSAGARLPTVRRLASELGIAPNTVARAYRELEVSGYVTTGGRKGTMVADQKRSADRDAARLTASYLDAMRALGHDASSAIRFLHQHHALSESH